MLSSRDLVENSPTKCFARFFRSGPPITADEVRGWFRDADTSGRLTVPSANACGPIARRLDGIAVLGKGPELLPPQYASLEKAVHKMLVELTIEQSAHFGRTSWCAMSANDLDYRAKLDDLERSANAILQCYAFPLPQNSWHMRAREIAAMARETWAAVGREPRALGETQPLVVFSAKALNAIRTRVGERKLSAAAVSDALRNRRGH